ncbi:MAG: 2-C-methyl-D-erythritol 4-phosphate cytidylyltransferase [Acidobacteriia bacterium]|nr:2-C-methyl-D-erythritol 4-phosphate cytidylyltransferase [Terriglobia bacterium]
MSIAAIIPAAGMGTRMGGDRPKQFYELGGVPILIRTLRKFQSSPLIDRLVVALREDEITEFSKLLRAESFRKPLDLVVGGNHRQESVASALEGIDAAVDEWVVVHDAVRPLFDPPLIERVITEARKTGAAICAIPVLDTLKQIDRQRVTATLPRERIVLVQTPQAFRTDLLRQAFEKAAAENFFGTDESMLMEHLGIEVGVVMGCERNIKITRPSDLPLAEFYLALESPGRAPQP